MSLITSFNKTNLDLENKKTLGGPNRTNSSNIPTGQYENNKSSTIFNTNTFGPLKEKDDTIVKTQLNRWTPTNTYLDSGDWKNKFPNLSKPDKTPREPRGSSPVSFNPFPNAGSFGGGI